MVDTAMGATKPSFRPYVSSNISGLPEGSEPWEDQSQELAGGAGPEEGIYITSLNSS